MWVCIDEDGVELVKESDMRKFWSAEMIFKVLRNDYRLIKKRLG